MSTFYDRLRDERKRLGLNQAEFAKLGGVQKETQLNYEKGVRKPDSDYLIALKGVGVDVVYVLFGEKSSSALSTDETFVIDGFRKLDVRGKAGVMALIDGMSTSAQNNIKGDVGQIINGDVSTESLSVTVGGKKK